MLGRDDQLVSQAQGEPADSKVPKGVVCCRCQYELAGLERAGVCPECGVGIGESYGGDLELYIKIEYLRALIVAAKPVVWSIHLALCAVLIWFVLMMVGVMARATAAVTLQIAGTVGAGGLLLALVGWCMGWRRFASLSSPMPGVAEMTRTQHRLRMALAVQVGLVGLVIAMALIAVAVEWSLGRAASNDWIVVRNQVSRLLICISIGACAVLGMALIQRNFDLFGRRDDARRAMRAGWSFAGALAFFASFGLTARLGMPPVMLGLIGVVVFAWVIGSTVVLARCVQDLNKTAQRALERGLARNASGSNPQSHA